VPDGIQVWSGIVEADAATPAQNSVQIVTWIARAVARHFDVNADVHARAGTLDTAAFESFLTARASWYRFNREGFRRSAEAYADAVVRDSNFVDARVGAAQSAVMLAIANASDARALLVAALSHARRAVEIEPDSAAAQATLGLALFYSQSDWQQSEVAFSRALALDPGNALFHQWAAGLFSATGRHDKAVSLARRAESIDPLSPSANVDLCWYYLFAGRYGDAASQAERAGGLSHVPALSLCRELAYRFLGDATAEAAAYRDRLTRFGGNDTPEVLAALADQEKRKGIAGVREFQFDRLRRAQDADRYVLAVAASAAGAPDVAIRVLSDAAKVRPLPYLNVDPSFRTLQALPAFKALTAKRP
jgi:tetratricopeptide (TPR) repeat protein